MKTKQVLAVSGIVASALGLALLVAFAVVYWVPDLLAGKCNRAAIMQYHTIAETLGTEISGARVATYDCEDGGYPVLEFTVVGAPQSIVDSLKCVERERWPTYTAYYCRSPLPGWLDLTESGSGSWIISPD